MNAAPSTSPQPRGDALSFAADAFRGAPPDALIRVTVAAPIADPLALPGLSSWWEPAADGAAAGAGSAAELRATGEGRFREILAGAASLWPRIADRYQPGAGGRGPRLVGGFSFLPGMRGAEWSAFGDACFRLPRVAYERSPAGATLSIIAPRNESAEAMAELAAALRALEAAAARPELPLAESARLLSRRQQPQSEWRERIVALTDAIAAGAVSKVVAARRTDIELSAAVSERLFLARLRDRHPSCFRFAFAAGGSLFAGASPERLLSRRGARVETEALAGSVAAGELSAAVLLGSDKDRREQAVVVRAIEAALEPLCSALSVPSELQIRSLRDVLHLQTPIVGHLAKPAHILELVELLHPTPAVGGHPRSAALEWIAAEPADRGWYAAPFGWFDARGDGEFAVAIRSGLVRGAHAMAYAGAGIVADSDPEREYEETELKQRALLRALGALE